MLFQNDRLTYSKDPTLVPTANPSTVVRETELTVKDVKKTDSGQYTCYATSRFVNQTQSSIQVDIRGEYRNIIAIVYSEGQVTILHE